MTSTPHPSDPLTIGGRQFNSRLFTGTGKYPSMAAMQQSIDRSGCEMVTVAVRRVQSVAAGHEGLMEAIDWSRIWMLPNTAGCTNAEEAIRVARLGRELAKLAGQDDNTFIKLEVIPDSRHLLPDHRHAAGSRATGEGRFHRSPLHQRRPTAGQTVGRGWLRHGDADALSIGSGQGLNNAANINLIIENATVPVVVDAGIGVPSEAAQALEMGADAVLVNSAIALAGDPAAMAAAMGQAVEAGRLAYRSGRLPKRAGPPPARQPMAWLQVKTHEVRCRWLHKLGPLQVLEALLHLTDVSGP